MTDTSATPPVQGEPARKAGHVQEGTGGVWSPPGLSWSLFEFARNPYFLLVVTFVFPPYFAQQVVGDPVQGQALVASATKWAGIVCALTAPLLGSIMDRGGRRKPLMAVFVGMMMLSSALLYFSEPKGEGGLGINGTILVLVLGFVSYTYMEVMHNAMLPLAGRREVLPHISGAGLGLGNGAGMLCLVLWALWVLVLSKALGIPQDYPLTRLLGPFMAVWFVIFVIPFFIYMPDGAPPGGSWSKATINLFRDGDGKVRVLGTSRRFIAHIISLFREFPEVMKYLLARIAFADALTTLLALAGVYASGVFQWTPKESPLYTAMYGVFGTACAAAGAFFGGVLDQRLGPRKAITYELSTIIVLVVIMLSIDRSALMFGLVPQTPFITTASYMALSGIVSFAIGACLSSSRFMLVSIAPKHRISEFFGLYALSATVTVWMGPLLVELVTTWTQDQRWGMSTILILLVLGFTLFVTLKVEPDKNAKAAAGH